MSGCSIEEAFPDTAQESGKVARKEERKKAKKCGGPALTFLKAGSEGNQKDPDRQHLNPLPPAQTLGGSEAYKFNTTGTEEGFADSPPSNTNWMPRKSTLPNSPSELRIQETVKNLMNQKVDDVIGEKSRNTLPRAIESTTQLPNPRKTELGQAVPSYFGKSIDSPIDGFADFSAALNDNPGYTLSGGSSTDFLGSFATAGLDKAAGKPILGNPSVNDAWKPLTPSGARSSFFENLPYPSGEVSSFSSTEKESLIKKIDILFARLEELETKRNEQNHVEVSLFVLSGLFLLYGLETVRRFA